MPEECDLYFELFPLTYYPITRKMLFKALFTSICYDPKEIIFEVDLAMNSHVNFEWHPRTVNLFLWGNYYKLIFKDFKIYDENDIMISKEYTNVNIEGLSIYNRLVKLTEKNQINLTP